jgi:hypothetical protein
MFEHFEREVLHRAIARRSPVEERSPRMPRRCQSRNVAGAMRVSVMAIGRQQSVSSREGGDFPIIAEAPYFGWEAGLYERLG